MKILLLYILIILTFKSSGQIADWELKENRVDSVCTVTAKKYIYQKLGKTFADKHLSYYGTFRHSDRVVLFKVKGTHGRHKILPIFFDTTSIDTKFTKVDKGQILKCLTKDCNNNYWIDTIEALKIAKVSTDFKNYIYYIQFIFHGSKTEPRWNFVIYFSGSTNSGYAEGETISVHAMTEKVTTGLFSVIP